MVIYNTRFVISKSLCLVLALVFVLGLCTFGSNAAIYSDAAQINYGNAVTVLTGLQIIEGYPDGTFQPTDNVTRAEAAAMIARMMLGREGADKLPIGDVKFTDVPETNWAAKYIAFCANKGIIVGMGDGTFRPSENVTGTQMATMLLRSLGYGVIGEYEGKGWDINAVADALYYGIFEDSEVTDFNQPATREETALYVFNTLDVELVGYDVDLNYYDGKETTFGLKVFKLVEIGYGSPYSDYDASYQVIENKQTGANYTVIRSLEDGKTFNLKYDTSLDFIGCEVTAYVRFIEKEDTVNHTTYYEAYLIDNESTKYIPGQAFATYDDMYRVLKAANKENLDTYFTAVPVWYNYDYTDVHAFGPVNDYDNYAFYFQVGDMKGQKSSNDLAWLFIGGTWILDHEGKILVVLKDSYKIGRVTLVDNGHDEVEVKVWDIGSHYYDPATKNTYTLEDYYFVGKDASGKVITNANGEEVHTLAFFGMPTFIAGAYDADNNLLFDVVDDSQFTPEVFDMKKGDIELVYDGIAKDDYVVVQPQGSLTLLKETSTEEAEITERNKVMSWSFNNGAYSQDGNFGIPVEDCVEDAGEADVGDKVLFYTVKTAFGTNFFAVEILEHAKSEGIVFVNYKQEAIQLSDWDSIDTPDADTAKVSTVLKVQAVNQDGEEVVYKMNKKTRALDNGFDNLKVGEVYEVFVRSGYATFKPVDGAKIRHTGNRTSYLTNAGKTYYVTDDTKVFYIYGTGADMYVEESSKLATGTYDAYVVARKSGGNYKLTCVWISDSAVEAPDTYGTDSLVYLKKSSGSTYCDKAGDEVFAEEKDPYYTIYIDGTKITHAHLALDVSAEELATLTDGDSIMPGFYKYEPDEELEGLYYIKPVTKNNRVAYLTKGSVKDGRLFYGESDGCEILCNIVDISGKTTTGTKTDAKINDLGRLEELLEENYVITVAYMCTKDADNHEIPVGTMYVTGIIAPAS